MYTRCPSCRAEISFEPPANASSLPDGFKHRLRCPNCGVTISVKLPRQEALLDAQPIYRQMTYQDAATSAPVYEAAPADYPQIKPLKKTGRGRSAVMMVFSLIIVALGIFAYLLNSNIIPIPMDGFLSGFGIFDGISVWESICTGFEGFKSEFAFLGNFGVATQVSALLPLFIFTLAAIHLIVSFACLIAGKFSRAYNLVAGIALGGFSVYGLFAFFMTFNEMFSAMGEDKLGIGNYFKDIVIGEQQYMWIALAAIGLIFIILSLCFLKSLKVKDKRN